MNWWMGSRLCQACRPYNLPFNLWHNVAGDVMSALHQQIANWLGIRPLRTERQVLQVVEEQLPTSAINKLLALGLTRQEIDALVIPLRTLQHRRSKREKLTIE